MDAPVVFVDEMWLPKSKVQLFGRCFGVFGFVEDELSTGGTFLVRPRLAVALCPQLLLSPPSRSPRAL